MEARFPIGVSVAICCYNSAKVLPETLRHLAQQRVNDDLDWEVVVVNNASTDETASVAKQTWELNGAPVPLRVVDETCPGLSSARRKGTLESKYSILIFCDDDNWLCETYVQDVFKTLNENPEIGLCGGVGEAVSDSDFPDWFPRHQRSYAVGAPAETAGPVEGYLYGAGMGMRRATLAAAYENHFESLLSDRKGRELSSGGDGEIAEWCAILGDDCWYFEPKLTFKHFIASDRLSKEYLKKLHRGFGKSYPILRIYRKCRQGKLTGLSRSWACVLVQALAAGAVASIRSIFNGSASLTIPRQLDGIAWLLRSRRRFFDCVEKVERMRVIANQLQSESIQHRSSACEANDSSPETMTT